MQTITIQQSEKVTRHVTYWPELDLVLRNDAFAAVSRLNSESARTKWNSAFCNLSDDEDWSVYNDHQADVMRELKKGGISRKILCLTRPDRNVAQYWVRVKDLEAFCDRLEKHDTTRKCLIPNFRGIITTINDGINLLRNPAPQDSEEPTPTDMPLLTVSSKSPSFHVNLSALKDTIIAEKEAENAKLKARLAASEAENTRLRSLLFGPNFKPSDGPLTANDLLGDGGGSRRKRKRPSTLPPITSEQRLLNQRIREMMAMRKRRKLEEEEHRRQ